MVRTATVFRGRVQGVGFRYTACRTAERFAVRGWVRNESDGTVRCEVDGSPDEIERFLAAVEEAMHDHVQERVVVFPGTEPLPREGLTVLR